MQTDMAFMTRRQKHALSVYDGYLSAGERDAWRWRM